jgi:hypothetical protein
LVLGLVGAAGFAGSRSENAAADEVDGQNRRFESSGQRVLGGPQAPPRDERGSAKPTAAPSGRPDGWKVHSLRALELWGSLAFWELQHVGGGYQGRFPSDGGGEARIVGREWPIMRDGAPARLIRSGAAEGASGASGEAPLMVTDEDGAIWAGRHQDGPPREAY